MKDFLISLDKGTTIITFTKNLGGASMTYTNSKVKFLKKLGWDLSERYDLKPIYDGFIKPHNDEFIYPYTTQKLLAGKPKKQLFVVLAAQGNAIKYYNTLLQVYGLPEAQILKQGNTAYLFWLVGYKYDEKFLKFIFIDDKHIKNKVVIDKFSTLIEKLITIHFVNDNTKISDKIPILPDLENVNTIDLFTMRKYTSSFDALFKEDLSYRTDYVLRVLCSIANLSGKGKIKLSKFFKKLETEFSIFISFYTLKRLIAFLNKLFDEAKFYLSENYFNFATNRFLNIPTLYGFRQTKSGIDNSWRLYSDWVNSWGKTKNISTLVKNYTERDIFWAMKQVLTKQKRWLITPKEIMEVKL